MSIYLAKMVGGNSALLVEVSGDGLESNHRIKCDWVLNLSLLKCYVIMRKNIPLSFLEGEQFIDFAYLYPIEKESWNNIEKNLTEFCKLSGYLYTLRGEARYPVRVDQIEVAQNSNVIRISEENKNINQINIIKTFNLSYSGSIKRQKIADNNSYNRKKIDEVLEDVFNAINNNNQIEDFIEELGLEIDFIEHL